MKKTDNLQLHPDPRCRRYSPDALPTHRECPDCPPGANVHSLDAQHFYETRTRFPWNLSRFTSRCRDYHRAMTSATYAADATAKNARRSERRRVVAANKKTAAIFFTPAQVAIRERKEAEQRERRERLALYKRRDVRARGGYDPGRDGIKLLIRERSKRYQNARPRAEKADHRSDAADVQTGAELNNGVATSQARLAALRAFHAAQVKARQDGRQ